MRTPRKTSLVRVTTVRVTMIAATVAAPLLGGSIHAAPADAAPMPTISVTLAGDSDWQITYHRGSATHHDARCRVWMDRQVVASFEQAAPHSAPPMLGTTTLRGYAVAAGAHQVNVRCGRSASPTIWLIAPRNQIFDGVTWLSNATAGTLGH